MIRTDELSLYEGRPFGNIMLKSNYSELIRLGFRPGDSVDVLFSSGKVLEDIPFLSACILPQGMMCLNAHESFDWLRIEKRFGSAWDFCGMKGDETGRIILHDPQKYAFLYRVFSTEFSLERTDYPSDECFTNYRELSCGHMRRGILYRSVASFDSFNVKPEFLERQKCLDRLMERDGIRYVINMTCDFQQMKTIFESGAYKGFYIQKLYDEGKVYSDLLSVDFSGPVFREQIASALRMLLKQPGPYLIQCKAGLDRTGFFCSLIGALAGADQAEITEEYMCSYDSLFGLTREKDREKYDILCRYQAERNIDIITQCSSSEEEHFSNEEQPSPRRKPEYTAGLCAAAEKYLKRCGFGESEISELKKLLME